MERKDVTIGETYLHKHRRVRITADLGTGQSFSGRNRHRGWAATNLATGRTVRIASAKGLKPMAQKVRVVMDPRNASLDRFITKDRAEYLVNLGRLAYDVTNNCYTWIASARVGEMPEAGSASNSFENPVDGSAKVE